MVVLYLGEDQLSQLRIKGQFYTYSIIDQDCSQKYPAKFQTVKDFHTQLVI